MKGWGRLEKKEVFKVYLIRVKDSGWQLKMSDNLEGIDTENLEKIKEKLESALKKVETLMGGK